MNKFVLLIGRWSPFHLGHKYLVDSHLNAGKNVCIAVRKSKEKYNPQERVYMIESVFKKQIEDGRVEVILIPDIEGVAVGRDVGYYIARVPEEVERISGTKIRAGESWDLPKEVKEILDRWEKLRIRREKK